jgi:RNA polymerase sigma-70 factor, ECF subfamily
VNSHSMTTAQLDAELIKRAQEGDAYAFAEIFNAHKALIYSLCLRMTNNRAEAEDLTQDAFLQVFRKLNTFRGASALSTWLYRIAVNTVLMHFRKKSFSNVSLDEPCTKGNGDTKPFRREYGTKDYRLSGCIDRITLNRAIRELPEGYRTVFLLHEVEGYEHQEIAEFLGCSTGNSKSQLHKARVRLRELLTQPQKAAPEAASRERAARQRDRMKAAAPRFAETWEPIPEFEMPPTAGAGLPQFVASNG